MLFIAKNFATFFFAIRFCTREVQFSPNFAPTRCNFAKTLHPRGAKSNFSHLFFSKKRFPLSPFFPTFRHRFEQKII